MLVSGVRKQEVLRFVAGLCLSGDGGVMNRSAGASRRLAQGARARGSA